ncbi:Putative PAS domain, RGS domain, PAS domain superfamily protein [Septoria linicola]|uniref:PAS domain, RGS domain, PAS domain superfamily protein n=1 Tax=Septoria linicola TaxID=215465 RepID=A0A9Q9EPD4_9PEZI|nr:putative PAS domain, RGS domain, PAS domain superfamily protein [Septoria linicola]USW58666.1 Putative PAS domain, RGS domain, PAS domain superfamily protein [Septoria linicola]
MTMPARLWTSPDHIPQGSGFDFDLPSPLTIKKSPSTFHSPQSYDWLRTTSSSSSLPPAFPAEAKKSAGPFELQANEANLAKIGTAHDSKASSTGSATRVDSGRVSTATSSDVQEIGHANCPDRSEDGGHAGQPSLKGPAQAYSAYSSLQRVLHPDSNHALLLDIMSRDTFLDALENPPAKHRLHDFSKAVLGPTHMAFLDQILTHRRALDECCKEVAQLDQQYLSTSPDTPALLAASTHAALRANVDTAMQQTLPNTRNMFDEAEQTVQNTIFSEVFPKFVRLQMTLSASEALSRDRHKFQGLGDCFCLTQPSKADNPIMFASDGFVAVTGYQREEIIPRNCRFLQGRDTDAAALDRIRHCIRAKQESVEFLLNYQKNGRPFWNLLYTAPLFDANGEVAFFLGGQVNCSSSVQGKPDIMKILATSPDHKLHESNKTSTNQKTHTSPATELARRVESVKSLRYRHKAQVAAEPGIERGLIEANQGTPLPDRLERFYNAYSKYLIISYPSLTIHFNSAGISDILIPSTHHHSNSRTHLHDQASRPNRYTDRHVFNFLKDHMMKREKKSDWQAKVRNSLKKGQPISVALNLQTKRSIAFRGDEKFLAHWTPLKDVEGKTGWVVLCLAQVW